MNNVKHLYATFSTNEQKLVTEDEDLFDRKRWNEPTVVSRICHALQSQVHNAEYRGKITVRGCRHQ